MEGFVLVTVRHPINRLWARCFCGPHQCNTWAPNHLQCTCPSKQPHEMRNYYNTHCKNEELNYKKTKGAVLKVLTGLLSWNFPRIIWEGNSWRRELNLSPKPWARAETAEQPFSFSLEDSCYSISHSLDHIPAKLVSFLSWHAAQIHVLRLLAKETDLLGSSAKVNSHIGNAINRLAIACLDGHGDFYNRHFVTPSSPVSAETPWNAGPWIIVIQLSMVSMAACGLLAASSHVQNLPYGNISCCEYITSIYKTASEYNMELQIEFSIRGFLLVSWCWCLCEARTTKLVSFFYS